MVIPQKLAQLSYNHTYPVRCLQRANRLSSRCSFKASCERLGTRWEVHEGKLMPDETNIVVKIFARTDLRTESECKAEVLKTDCARRVLGRCPELQGVVGALGCSYAEVEKLGRIAKHVLIFDTKHSSARKSDFVVIQNRLSKPIEELLRPDGTARGDHPALEAFAHASYHFSNGAYVIAGMKGAVGGAINAAKTYTLTSLVCHSRSLMFGSDDLGEDGIRTFFENHQCTSFCIWMKIYGVDTVVPSAPLLYDIC